MVIAVCIKRLPSNKTALEVDGFCTLHCLCLPNKQKRYAEMENTGRNNFMCRLEASNTAP
jgi:hypothetical protein